MECPLSVYSGQLRLTRSTHQGATPHHNVTWVTASFPCAWSVLRAYLRVWRSSLNSQPTPASRKSRTNSTAIRQRSKFRHGGILWAYPLSAADDPAEVVGRTNRKPTSTGLPPRTASLAFASLDYSHWCRRSLERAGLALPERGSLFLWSDASAPVFSNRPRWWQLIQECQHSAARPKRFRDPPHRETCSRLAAICGTCHTEMRKVSCPAPAPPQSLRNTVPMNQLLVGCSDLPSPIFFLLSHPMQVESSFLALKKLFGGT